MGKIQILGTGCPKCKKLSENVEIAAKELGLVYELEKVQEIDQILEFGVISTPAVVVNGNVKVMGKVPSIEELKQIIQSTN